MKTRLNIINSFLSICKNPKYLEIGIRDGKTLFEVKSGYKVAVDPNYQLSRRTKYRKLLKNGNYKIKYFWMTSDDFFVGNPLSMPKDFFDLIFIDGLHTYEQSYRDIENGLKHLKNNGLIIVHDCNPIHPLSASPQNPYEKKFGLPSQRKENPKNDWDGTWNGDVWKSILRVRMEFPELSVSVLNTDQGLGIISKVENIPNIDKTHLVEIDIDNLKYADLDKNRVNWLNLIDSSLFENWLQKFSDSMR